MESTEFPSKRTRQKLIDAYFAKIQSLSAGDALVLKISLFATGAFLLVLIALFSTSYTIKIPAFGGTFQEGIVGTPRFVNPVLAVTRADKDLVALVYDGLLHLGTDGKLQNNIAESMTISDDGLTYNIILRKDVTFHDGTPLTARDVLFTVGKIQDPQLNSPLRASFDGVTVEQIGDYEINFVLPAAYAPFSENLTFGILPEHIWKDANDDEFPFSKNNSDAIGTGPYTVKEIQRNPSGIPEMYTLGANTHYHRGTPKIEIVALHFYPTEDGLITAFKKGDVEAVVGIDPKRLEEFGFSEKTHHLERIPLPRTFALFINQNKSEALRDPSARKALDLAVDRKSLIETTLGGYGNPIISPIPPGFGAPTQEESPVDGDRIEKARDVLKSGGWKINPSTQVWEKTIGNTVTPLRFSISTANSNAFNTLAESLRATWATLGAEVEVKQYEQSDLTQTVIRPRDYETLLFGTQLGRSLDYYSFWHSSQRNDPGLNVALYANITTDSILAEMRRDTHEEERLGALKRFSDEIYKETPAVFLYTPELLYIFPNRVTGATFQGVSEPNERFSNSNGWYIQTESIWPFFRKLITE